MVYLILGCRGSGQFEIVSDLIEFGLGKEENAVVYCSASDKAEAEGAFSVKTREARLESYDWSDGALSLQPTQDSDAVFVMADGIANPAEFVEAFHAWLGQAECELGRVLTVLHCQLAVESSETLPWFDCCIHFSDVVLLNRRERLSNRQVQDLIAPYESQHYPCLIEYVKKGRVSNPALVLVPEPRRISRLFDVPEVFEDDDPDEIEEELAAGDPSKDRYLARGAGGRPTVTLPDISKYV